VVEGHAVADAPAAVVAAEGEALEAEVLHHFDLIECHSAFGVAGVVFAALRLGGVTVSAQVRSDYREVFGEARGEEVPHRERLGAAVEQHQRRPAAAVTDSDRRLGGVDRGKPKTFEHENRSLRSLVGSMLPHVVWECGHTVSPYSTLSRDVLLSLNEYTLLLVEGKVCAPQHKTSARTFENTV
jgi:hypothetical protein